jgi:glycosyltransferase involved in cell wall biosynthesis
VLVEGLREHGAEVVELNQPLGLSTADRVDILRRPWRLAALVSRLVGRWMRLLASSRSVRRPAAVVVPYLGHFDVLLARARWPRRTVVLDYLVSGAATARDRGVRGGIKLRLLDTLDRLAIRAADIVVVDTLESEERLPAAAHVRSIVVPVGATTAWFAAGAEPRASTTAEQRGGLRAIFFGSFTPLQGTVTMARALARLPVGTVETTLLGSGQDYAEVRRLLSGRPDVTWHDWVAIDRLPGLVAAHDVCLGIFGTTEKALTVVPTKVYQGAAAGCALVSSDTEPHRRALGDAALLVPPGDDAALADVLAALAADPARVEGLRASAREVASDFTPGRAVAPLMACLAGPSRMTP